jgi:sugar lactone lactonase YvrE
VAVGPEDQIFVVGDQSLTAFTPQGEPIKTVALDDQPHCVAVAGADHAVAGRVYVGMKDRVEILDSLDSPAKSWESLGKKAILTSLAVADRDIFAADAGNRIVWHYDANGKQRGSIGGKDESRNIRGFIIYSPCFDVAIAPDGLLRVVNPGAHKIDAYTFDGHLELSWGKSGLEVPAFCGCCNPAALAILPDGRIVTGEKGIPRVKIYDAEGKFECVVVGPDVLAPNLSAVTETRDDLRLHPIDLATDSKSRIIVLDPNAKKVRIFEEKSK